MSSLRPPVRIAHAYGNTRDRLPQALAASVDLIEADVWFRAGEIWVRHERRLGTLPLLADRLMRGHPTPRFALKLPHRYYVRPDLHPLTVGELLETAHGKGNLMLDVKGHGRGEASTFAGTLARRISQHNRRQDTVVCGQNWPVLHALRQAAGDIEVRYSIETQEQWDEYVQMVDRDNHTGRLCMQSDFFDEHKSSFLKERSIDVYCWTVDDPTEARRLLSVGANGIISNSLPLLEALRDSGPAPRI
jgi:glycerophosphoryl diester phosphodiesterase